MEDYINKVVKCVIENHSLKVSGNKVGWGKMFCGSTYGKGGGTHMAAYIYMYLSHAIVLNNMD